MSQLSISLGPEVANRLDRMHCGDARGNVVEVFDPPWWKFHRWVKYFLTRNRTKGTISVSLTNGRVKNLRVLGVKG